MYGAKHDPAQRKRAPSKRSLQTGQTILDAAEALFAERGFEGTSIRDIARQAGVTPALVNFHGGSKDKLFETVVMRRADELSERRIERLETLLKSDPKPTPRQVIESFVAPYLEMVADGNPQWLAYARLVAIVSSDIRWAALTTRCFDPTAQRFAATLQALCPGTDRRAAAAGFVFTVSSMLSLCTSQWRISALAGQPADTRPDPSMTDTLVDFCEAGLRAICSARD